MATAPAISSVATNSPCLRLPSMPLRRAPAAISFPSRCTLLFLPQFRNHQCPTCLDLFLLFLLRAAWPAARTSCTGLSRRSDVVAAAGHQKLMGSLTSNEGLRFGVVVARFNEVVTNLLLQGALETFERYSVKAENITVVSVPGSFEVPITAQKLGKSGKFDAILCIGAVIRGDTTHYDAVANSAASGVLNAGLSAGVPCVFGVLTCEDMDQALNRAGGKAGNKGAETALTAIEMASLFRHHLG